MRSLLVLITAVSILGCEVRLETIMPKAQAGDPSAQLALGRLYMTGDQVEPDTALAVEWIRKSALQGNPEAESLLAFAYERGEGVEADPFLALEWHEKAANQGVVASYAGVGRCYLYCKGMDAKPHAGVTWLRKGAKEGDVEAQALLGAVFLHGWGRTTVRSNKKLAERWLKAAAAQGRAQDQFNYAHMYYENDVFDDFALEPLRKSVAQDYPKAIVLLATMYRNGEGLPLDPAKAVELLSRDAVADYPSAQNELGLAYREGNGIEQDVDESFRLFNKAGGQGYVEAQYNIALAYLDGLGVEKDTVRGYAWLRVCTAQSHRMAVRERGRRNDDINRKEFLQARKIAEEIAATLPGAWSEE
jgi:hypothetical protein